MGAFKQFLSTDVTVVPFVVNKSFSFKGTGSFSSDGIERLAGINTYLNSIYDIDGSLYQSQSVSLVYNSIKQLYYTNYIPNPISDSPYITDFNNQVVEDDSLTNVYSRFYNYESTTLFQTNSLGYTSNYGYSRYFPTSSADDGGAAVYQTSVAVLSVPKNLFGDYINSNTFYYSMYFSRDNVTLTFTDNGEGIVYVSGSVDPSTPDGPIGIINYQHGTVVLAYNWEDIVGDWVTAGATQNNITCSFQSSRTIFETQYKCTIRPDEFNFSLNPSLISGSTDGTIYNYVTSSYFSPYATTVGFYNESQELLMVAKLAKPLPTSATTDTTILVNIDK
jgi:hypothetical protein